MAAAKKEVADKKGPVIPKAKPAPEIKAIAQDELQDDIIKHAETRGTAGSAEGPKSKYRVVKGKSAQDIAGTMQKYIVTMLGGMSVLNGYWFQTFMGYTDPDYVAPEKPRTNTPQLTRKPKQNKAPALGNQPSVATAGNFGKPALGDINNVPADMRG